LSNDRKKIVMSKVKETWVPRPTICMNRNTLNVA